MLCPPCAEDVRGVIDQLRAAGKPVNAMAIARKIFRDTYSEGAYQLRDIPTELWDKAKHQTINEKISLRELILKALYEYLARA